MKIRIVRVGQPLQQMEVEKGTKVKDVCYVDDARVKVNGVLVDQDYELEHGDFVVVSTRAKEKELLGIHEPEDEEMGWFWPIFFVLLGLICFSLILALIFYQNSQTCGYFKNTALQNLPVRCIQYFEGVQQ